MTVFSCSYIYQPSSLSSTRWQQLCLSHGPMMRHLPRQPLVAWEPSNFNYTLWGSSTCLRHHRLLGALPLLGPSWWANLSFSESSVCKCLSHWGCISCILCDLEQIWPKTTLFFLTAPAGDGTNNFNILRGPSILRLIEMLQDCPMMPHFP